MEIGGQRAFGDIAAGSYRSRGRERGVLDRVLSGDIAAGGYRSRTRERAVLEGELSEEAEGCTQRRLSRRRGGEDWVVL